MHEIICPHCNKAFKIDETGYADILKQVRDGVFDNQLHERLELAERERRDANALSEAPLAHALQGAAVKKDFEIQALQVKLEAGESSGASTNFDVDAFLKTKRQQLAGSVGKDAATHRAAAICFRR